MPTIAFPLTVEFQGMPLAVYREVQSHLQQLDGLTVELLPQTSPQFDYRQSQIGGIRLNAAPGGGELHYLQGILAYYHALYPLTTPDVLQVVSKS